jgi:hypothetical protein
MSRGHTLRLSFLMTIVAALVLFGLAQESAVAKLVACRSDPLVVLSNGTIVDVSADIETLLWNVTEVHYTLNIPEGLHPVLIVHTPTWLTSKETFTITADQPANQYTSSTTVHTRTNNVGVTAHMLVNLGYGSASGVNGQTLTINLSSNGLLNLGQ